MKRAAARRALQQPPIGLHRHFEVSAALIQPLFAEACPHKVAG